MEINELKQQIKSGDFSKWYIFTVNEAAIAKVYIQKIAEKSKSQVEYVDSIADVYSKLRQKSLVKLRHLYVIIDDKDFLKNEKAWQALGNGRDLNDDIVIFYYTEVDGRLKFWKNFKDQAVSFEKLTERLLVKHIQQIVPLSETHAKKLIDMTEGDYSTILLELDKIKQYAGGKLLYDDAFELLLKQGVLYSAPKDAIFDFVNAVLERKPLKSYALLQESYEVGESNMVLISVLYNNFRNLLQVQTCNNSDVSKSTGLSAFQIKCVSPFINNYSTGELIFALRLLRDIEVSIKRGTIADEISVNYFLSEVL